MEGSKFCVTLPNTAYTTHYHYVHPNFSFAELLLHWERYLPLRVGDEERRLMMCTQYSQQEDSYVGSGVNP